MPQAILLNIRGKCRFYSGGSKDYGTLDIPDSLLPLIEVDGQHRIGGLRRAVALDPEMSHYPVIVVLTEDLKRLQEAVLFYVINTTQKRVGTDIAQRIIAQELKDESLRKELVEEGKGWMGKATELGDILQEKPNQPWHGRISIPGERSPGAIIRQTTLIQSLKPILTAKIYEDASVEELSVLLIRYWCAIRDCWPEAFAEPKDHVIQKGTGVTTLHMVAPSVFESVRAEHGRVTDKGIKEILQGLKDKLEEDFWHVDGYAGPHTSHKGHLLVADRLRGHFPEGKRIKIV
jgi:DGQHR domain-containing protein